MYIMRMHDIIIIMDSVQLDEVQWSSPEWVQIYGLRNDNVMDYFALSPFYDRSTNNEVLKMQSNFNEQLQSRRADLNQELRRMKGMEYEVSTANEPDSWVIRKQERLGPELVQIVSVYYICGQNIYQSPSIYNVLVSRLLATSKNLKTAQEIAHTLPTFTSSGYKYETKDVGIQGQTNGTDAEKALKSSLDVTVLQAKAVMK